MYRLVICTIEENETRKRNLVLKGSNFKSSYQERLSKKLKT